MEQRNRLIIYFDEVSSTSDFYDINLDPGIVIPLTYSIAEISDPSKRKSDFSKTVVIPGTSHNNQVFQHLYEIGVDDTFNVWRKKRFVLLQDGIEVMSGSMGVLKINRDDYNRVTYEVILLGRYADIFLSLKDQETGKDLLLSDLDFSRWDHPLEFDSIVDSWDGQVLKDGSPYSNITLGATQSITAVGGTTSGNVQLTYSISHNLQVGDLIDLTMDNLLTPNGSYNGTWTVVTVVSNTRVIINCRFNVAATETAKSRKRTYLGEGYVYSTILPSDPMPTGEFGTLSSGYTGETEGFWTSDLYLYRYANKPSLYVKEILDRIFESQHFTYSSEFFNTQFFKRLVMPWNREQIIVDPLNVFDYGFRVGLGATAVQDEYNVSTSYRQSQVTLADETSEGYYDQQNVWDNTLYEFTAPFSQQYSFSGTLQLEALFEDIGSATPGSGVFSFQTPSVKFEYYMELISSTVGNIWTGPVNISPMMGAVGQTFSQGATFSQDLGLFTFNTPPITIGQGDTVTVNILWRPFLDNLPNQADTYFGQGGNYYYFRNNVTAALSPGTAYLRVINAAVQEITSDAELVEGDTLDMSFVVPRMTCKEFLDNLVKLFNLYVQPDPLNPYNLIIEPRDVYYTDDEVVDWTDKLDISSTLSLEPLVHRVGDKFTYSYTLDKDRPNSEFTAYNQTTYGSHIYEIDNDFNSSTKEIKPTFASTPLMDLGSLEQRLVWPCIFSSEGKVLKDFLPRIFIHSGKKPYEGTVTYVGNDYVPHYVSQVGPHFTQVGFAAHVDDPFYPTVDINYGMLDGLNGEPMYNGAVITTNNLFYTYHFRDVEELTNRNSRLVSGWFNLNASDINELSFRKIYLVDGHYLRLQKINEYDPGGDNVTFCEFLKVIRREAYVTQNGGVPIGATVSFPDNPNGLYNTQRSAAGNIAPSSTLVTRNLVMGNNNTVNPSLKNTLLIGDNSNISQEGVYLRSPYVQIGSPDGGTIVIGGSGQDVQISNSSVSTWGATSTGLDGTTVYTTYREETIEVAPGIYKYFQYQSSYVDTTGATGIYLQIKPYPTDILLNSPFGLWCESHVRMYNMSWRINWYSVSHSGFFDQNQDINWTYDFGSSGTIPAYGTGTNVDGSTILESLIVELNQDPFDRPVFIETTYKYTPL